MEINRVLFIKRKLRKVLRSSNVNNMSNYKTYLHNSQGRGDTLLINCGADVNAVAYEDGDIGWIPVYFLCYFGSESVQIHLISGANVNVRTSSGRTPLHNALSGYAALGIRPDPIRQQYYYHIVQMLMDMGANKNARTGGGTTYRDQTSDRKMIDIIEGRANNH